MTEFRLMTTARRAAAQRAERAENSARRAIDRLKVALAEVAVYDGAIQAFKAARRAARDKSRSADVVHATRAQRLGATRQQAKAFADSLPLAPVPTLPSPDKV
jgi:hypothetical protein